MRTLLLALVVALTVDPAGGATPRLVEWERGIALEPSDDPGMTMYLRWPASEENAAAGILVRRSQDGRWVTGIG